jgi:hypothetical protein
VISYTRTCEMLFIFRVLLPEKVSLVRFARRLYLLNRGAFWYDKSKDFDLSCEAFDASMREGYIQER